MATYTHFAKQPDVLKHLILCEVLRNEAPQVYVETNSACAIYISRIYYAMRLFPHRRNVSSKTHA